MQTMNITNAKGLHTYYADRVLNIMRNINSTPIVWQDVWDEQVEVGLFSIELYLHRDIMSI